MIFGSGRVRSAKGLGGRRRPGTGYKSGDERTRAVWRPACVMLQDKGEGGGVGGAVIEGYARKAASGCSSGVQQLGVEACEA